MSRKSGRGASPARKSRKKISVFCSRSPVLRPLIVESREYYIVSLSLVNSYQVHSVTILGHDTTTSTTFARPLILSTMNLVQTINSNYTTHEHLMFTRWWSFSSTESFSETCSVRGGPLLTFHIRPSFPPQFVRRGPPRQRSPPPKLTHGSPPPNSTSYHPLPSTYCVSEST